MTTELHGSKAPVIIERYDEAVYDTASSLPPSATTYVSSDLDRVLDMYYR